MSDFEKSLAPAIQHDSAQESTSNVARGYSEKSAGPAGNLHKQELEQGYGKSEEVKLDSKGTVLRPMPSDSPLDPLNWPRYKKHVCLAVVAAYYFLFTFLTTVTVPSFADLQTKLNITYAQVNYTVAVPALGLAMGHLFFSPFAPVFGRRIVFLVSCLVALGASIGSALSTSYSGYMAARFFQGFGVSPAATVGLMIIDDLYFEHERGQKVGIWCLAIDIGLVIGPLPGGFISAVSVDWPAWLTAILFGTVLIMMLFFLPETLFERHTGTTPRKVGFLNFRPLGSQRKVIPWISLSSFLVMFTHYDVAIAVIYYCWSFYWWVLTVITLVPAAYAQYSASVQGLLFIGLIAGTLFAETFLSGGLSDRLVARLAASNDGIRKPEYRLWLMYPAALLAFTGITLFGRAIQENYHWIVSQIGLALFAAGIQQSNTMISSYMLDCYPELTMKSVIFYTVNLNLAAFVSPFFAAAWQAKDGFGWSFTAQGLIVLATTALVVPFLQIKGPSLRRTTKVY